MRVVKNRYESKAAIPRKKISASTLSFPLRNISAERRFEMFVSFLVLLGISTFARGLRFPQAEPTHPSEHLLDGSGWTPKPTDGPKLVGYSGLYDPGLGLRPRADGFLSTCGYVYGYSEDPVTCVTNGDYCVFNTAVGRGYFGCCSQDAYGNFPGCFVSLAPTSCYDYTASAECVGACTIENIVW